MFKNIFSFEYNHQLFNFRLGKNLEKNHKADKSYMIRLPCIKYPTEKPSFILYSCYTHSAKYRSGD